MSTHIFLIMFQTLLLDSNQLLQGRREVQTIGLEQIILNLVVWDYHVLDRIDDVNCQIWGYVLRPQLP